jgi:hypothetical protein
VVFVGDSFILQVHRVFTRIRSGATAMALYCARAWIYKLSTAAVCTGGDPWLDLLGMAVNVLGEKPYGFWLLFISQRRPLQRLDG